MCVYVYIERAGSISNYANGVDKFLLIVRVTRAEFRRARESAGT